MTSTINCSASGAHLHETASEAMPEAEHWFCASVLCIVLEGINQTFLFHCDDDQCEVILKATVAEADHIFLNRHNKFGGA
jgi:hypothetical protein